MWQIISLERKRYLFLDTILWGRHLQCGGGTIKLSNSENNIDSTVDMPMGQLTVAIPGY